MSIPEYHPPALPCACSALRQATRAVSRHYEAFLAPAGVTVTQYSLLRYLQREGATPLRRIANAMELERTSLYRALATLERDGLVRSWTDPDDARVKQAELTEAGGLKIVEALPHWQRAQTTFMAAVGEVEWLGVAQRLEELREGIAHDPEMHGQLPGVDG